jgi:hypothetical protein
LVLNGEGRKMGRAIYQIAPASNPTEVSAVWPHPLNRVKTHPPTNPKHTISPAMAGNACQMAGAMTGGVTDGRYSMLKPT